MTDKPVPIDLVPFAETLGGAREFLRVWARGDGASLVFVNPRVIGADPGALGLAIADIAHHGAMSYAKATNLTEAEALARIWEALDAARAAPAENDLPPPVALARRDED